MDHLQLHVNLEFQQLVEVINQLSPTEKLKLNEALWNTNMTIPLEHQELVLERMKKSKQDSGRMVDWNTASKKLKS